MAVKRKTIPELFCTNVRKIEPIGGDCIRIYCSIEKDGAWEDQFTILAPIVSALTSAHFVIEAAGEIVRETEEAVRRARAH